MTIRQLAYAIISVVGVIVLAGAILFFFTGDGEEKLVASLPTEVEDTKPTSAAPKVDGYAEDPDAKRVVGIPDMFEHSAAFTDEQREFNMYSYLSIEAAKDAIEDINEELGDGFSEWRARMNSVAGRLGIDHDLGPLSERIEANTKGVRELTEKMKALAPKQAEEPTPNPGPVSKAPTTPVLPVPVGVPVAAPGSEFILVTRKEAVARRCAGNSAAFGVTSDADLASMAEPEFQKQLDERCPKPQPQVDNTQPAGLAPPEGTIVSGTVTAKDFVEVCRFIDPMIPSAEEVAKVADPAALEYYFDRCSKFAGGMQVPQYMPVHPTSAEPSTPGLDDAVNAYVLTQIMPDRR